MRVCVLHPSYEGSSSPCNGLDPDAAPGLWLRPHHEVDDVKLQKSTAVKQLIELSKRGYDCFLNLCDGAWDEDRAGIEVVDALEKLNLPYTGAIPAFYDPSKELMKTTALYYGVPTPGFRTCWNLEEVVEAGQELRYPLIVKHHNGYNSIGLTRKSRCTEEEQLRTQAEEMISSFGGCMVEEFVDGREYTILVTENPDCPSDPIVFTPVECKFPDGETFKHFDLKWVNYEGIQWAPVEDESVASKLRDMAQKVFVGLGGTGYGRIDARGDNEGNVYFLEINPNCGIFYPPEAMGSADFILTLDATTDHKRFVNHILRCAQLRHARKQKPFKVVYSNRTKGFGVFAVRDIRAGELVFQGEEQATYLVSRAHVEKTWTNQQKRWFAQYCYPVSKNISAMWSDKPEDWKPINHSCDPNTWLQGLDTVARRDVKKGEELTIDYATFCVDCEAFECCCGAAACRRRVTGKEHLEPWLEDVYQDHVSDYIRQIRSDMMARKANGKVFAEELLPLTSLNDSR